MLPEISIIVPVFNVGDCLERCIESIRRQTFNNYEILLIDDGSTDKSVQLCDWYSSLDDHIKVVHQSNKGVSSARNTGINMAQGKYISFVDSDDWIEETFLEQALQIVKKESCELYISGYVEEHFNNNVITKKVSNTIKETKKFDVRSFLEAYNVEYVLSITSVWDKLYLTKIVKQYNLWFDEDMDYGEDANFNFRYLAYCNYVFFDKTIYYHYVKTDRKSLSNFDYYHNNLFEACVKNTIAFKKVCEMKKCNSYCMGLNIRRFELDIITCIEQEYKFKPNSKERYKLLLTISNNFLFQSMKIKSINLFSRFVLYMLKNKRIKIIHSIFTLKYQIVVQNHIQ